MLWRWPTLLYLVGLAALAVQPTILFGREDVFYDWGLQHALVALALLANAITCGVRPTVNWPILALIGVLALNLAFGTHPGLTLGFMLFSLFILALPWSFTQVVMAPEARRHGALVIVLAPLLSLAAAGVLQAAGMLKAHPFRIKGAAGDAAIFATLAFAGFAVALHEATRPGRTWLACLAVVDFALVILSGTRMAILASVVFAGVYGLSSAELRRSLRAHPVPVMVASGALVAVLVWYSPILLFRLTSHGHFRWSERDQLWSLYFEDFLNSPAFGRGLGAGFVTLGELPHNEYLHLLVVGGWVGFVLCIAAIGLWLRQLLGAVARSDRAFLIAVIPAVAVYWLTDNLLVYPTALGLYAYLGLLLADPDVRSSYATNKGAGQDRNEPAMEAG